MAKHYLSAEQIHTVVHECILRYISLSREFSGQQVTELAIANSINRLGYHDGSPDIVCYIMSTAQLTALLRDVIWIYRKYWELGGNRRPVDRDTVLSILETASRDGADAKAA